LDFANIKSNEKFSDGMLMITSFAADNGYGGMTGFDFIGFHDECYEKYMRDNMQTTGQCSKPFYQ